MPITTKCTTKECLSSTERCLPGLSIDGELPHSSLLTQFSLVFQQMRRHGDIFQRFSGGFYRAHGRSDDTMNLGGIKVSSMLSCFHSRFCLPTILVTVSILVFLQRFRFFPCFCFLVVKLVLQASAVEIEQVCNKAHESVQETAAIAVQPPGGGPEELVIAVVLKPGYESSNKTELQKLFYSHVMSNLNPLFKVQLSPTSMAL